MIKPEKAVRDNTIYIAVITLILSVLMQAIFLIIGFWKLTVLFGNLLGAVVAVANFYIMGLTVQQAVLKDEKQAKSIIKLSQTLRTLSMVVIAAAALVLNKFYPLFHPIAFVLPLLFPRIAIAMYPLFHRKEENTK